MLPITVFTATYNRKDTLERLYISLTQQTCMEFEWIVIDDESSDLTQKFMNKIQHSDNLFSIFYVKQEHGGKHRAINKGILLAKGRYFFIVDSDDYLLPQSIETVKKWIDMIEGREDLAGVSGLKVYPDGNITGEHPDIRKDAFIEASNLERYRLKLNGDKAEIYRTKVLRNYPFPEIQGEYFMTERICWDAIAADGYKLRWYNTPIYVCEYLEDGLSRSGSNLLNGHLSNFHGYSLFIKQALKVCEISERVTFFREYNKTAKKKRMLLKQRANNIGMGIKRYLLYCWFVVPLGYLKRFCIR